MPKTKIEIKKWLMEDMGFTEKEITDQKLVEAFTPDRVAKLEDGYMRQSDYDKSQNELKADVAKQQADLKTAQTNLDTEVAEWATVQAGGKKATDQMRTDLDAAQNDVLRFQQALKRTAEANGLNYDDLVKGIEVKPVVKPDVTPVPFDESKFVTRESYLALTNMALLVPAQLDRIQREHFDLTGEYLNPEDLVAEVQERARTKGNTKSLELRDIWEEKHGIAEKRTAKTKKEHDDEIAAAEKRGREAAYSESALPGGGATPVGSHAPIFRGDRKSVLERPQPQVASQAAVTALRSGKYRQPPVGAPASGASGVTK